MGITIHYRGTMDKVEQIESMEDRVLDLVFSLGGRATIWRSFADHDASRVVRGLMIEMEPEQDTFSLLISPEGHLTPLFQIEEAEKTPFVEPPDCFVKTQYGSLQGHIAIVHILDALRKNYFSNLHVSDEGEYFENRSVRKLNDNMRLLREAIGSMAEGLRNYGLSDEAAEDPDILATRIERIATLVHQKMNVDRVDRSASAEHAGDPTDDDPWNEPTLEEEVEVMDQLRRKNDARSERMARRIAEATAAGMSIDDAFEQAMQEEGLSVPRRETDYQDETVNESVESAEPWTESLPPHPFDEASEAQRNNQHPAVDQAQAFLLCVLDLPHGQAKQSSFYSILGRASVDIVGGLVQATSDGLGGDPSGSPDRALAITQLKRAITGHAYARGAVFGLRSEEAISDQQSTQFHEDLESLLNTLHDLMERAWQNPNAS